MYSPHAVIGSTCTCTGLYMYMMRHNEQSKATQHHHLRWLSFKENVSCPRWDSNPHHCLSALSTNYRGSSVVVGCIRQHRARPVSLYPLINRGNSNSACATSHAHEQSSQCTANHTKRKGRERRRKGIQ